MADDWQPGDLALCVRGGLSRFDPTRPGAVYTVSDIVFNDTDNEYGLAFNEVPTEGPDYYGFYTARFRKIRPHTPDAEDAETIRLLTGAPVKESAA